MDTCRVVPDRQGRARGSQSPQAPRHRATRHCADPCSQHGLTLGGMKRRDAARQRPPGDMNGFPSRRLTTRRRWSRCHRRENGTWFYSSTGGRWDLPEPNGTCYVAENDRGAVLEVVGPDLYDQGFVTEGFLRQRVLSTVTMPKRPVVADLLDAE